MKRILVATDFSERSDRAVRRATLVAKQTGASLILVHVIDDDQPRRLLKAEQRAAEAMLTAQAQSLREIDGLTCTGRIVLGDPFAGITAAMREEDADLLVLGPHRRQLLRDVFIGTTAERSIRVSERPVLMANGVPAGPYRHVLVAVDLSDGAAAAVRALQHLGLRAKAALSVVHVFEAPAAGLMVRASVTEDQVEEYLADEEARASAALADFLRKLKLAPLRRLMRPRNGSVAHSIAAAAHEAEADLIVVGTQGRKGLEKAVLGSVAEELLRRADRDVLAVPPGRDG